eukprot:4790441-Prymnesium_polylepis.1
MFDQPSCRRRAGAPSIARSSSCIRRSLERTSRIEYTVACALEHTESLGSYISETDVSYVKSNSEGLQGGGGGGGGSGGLPGGAGGDGGSGSGP